MESVSFDRGGDGYAPPTRGEPKNNVSEPNGTTVTRKDDQGVPYVHSSILHCMN